MKIWKNNEISCFMDGWYCPLYNANWEISQPFIYVTLDAFLPQGWPCVEFNMATVVEFVHRECGRPDELIPEAVFLRLWSPQNISLTSSYFVIGSPDNLGRTGIMLTFRARYEWILPKGE